jgi:MoxR-like ATPase
VSSCSSSALGGNPERPDRSLYEIADRLETMAQALKALSDSSIRRDIIHEMRTLLAEIEQRL